MDGVCKQLDDVVLQIFQVLENIYEKQEKLEQVMRQGFLGISRARYLLGVKWVSMDQILDADLTAKYRTLVDRSLIEKTSTLNMADKAIHDSDMNKLTYFELSHDVIDECVEKRTDATDKKAADVESQPSLRKRHPENKESTNKSTYEGNDQRTDTENNQSVHRHSKKQVADDDNEVKSKKVSSSNSLSLFGILTPQPLRSSQAQFQEAVQIAVSLADLKFKLSLLQENYKQLTIQKHGLLEEEQ